MVQGAREEKKHNTKLEEEHGKEQNATLYIGGRARENEKTDTTKLERGTGKRENTILNGWSNTGMGKKRNATWKEEYGKRKTLNTNTRKLRGKEKTQY